MEEHDDDIGNTSDWVSQKSKQHKSCCCSRKIRWNLLIVFLVLLTTLCLGSIGFSIYLMLQFQDLSVELKHAVLRNSSLHNRFQIEQSEDEEKHNENINNMAITLNNYTNMFNQNIGKLEVDVSDLTKMYENQVKIQSDIQKLIETNNRNIRMKIAKIDTTDIEVQKQINEIVRTQNVIQQKLSDIVLAGSNEHISKQKRNHSEWISYTSGIHTLLLSMVLFIIICM